MQTANRQLNKIQLEVLCAISELENKGMECTGFQISQEIERQRLAIYSRPPSTWEKFRAMIGYGTLYNALSNLMRSGKLTSQWNEEKPRKKLYRLTNEGKEIANSK